jgi:hypothetical protein
MTQENMSAEVILKKYPQYSRNDFGLDGDGTPHYIHINDAAKAMEEYANKKQATPSTTMEEEREVYEELIDEYLKCLHCGAIGDFKVITETEKTDEGNDFGDFETFQIVTCKSCGDNFSLLEWLRIAEYRSGSTRE